MKLSFIIIFVNLIHLASARNYYFSSLSGLDSRTTSEAQDPATPWKTLNKLNLVFSNLEPGDSVFFKRNEIFYGSLVLKKIGSTTSPIVISAYGTGNKPVITSFVTLTGWVSKGKNIWESADSLSSKVNMVILNGIEYGMGRYPNRDAANNGYLNFESHDRKRSITDYDLPSSVNWTGAELVLRMRHWILDRSIINSQSGHTIFYFTPAPYRPYDGYGYFIQNSIKTLDKFGEWYYNPSTKKLDVYFGADNPSSYVLRAATRGNLISSIGCSNVVFDGLTVKGCNNSGFFIIGGSNIVIQNCDIQFSGEDAVSVMSHPNFQIQNCTISDQNNSGIDLELGDSALIKNNTITNTYLIAGMGKNGEGRGNAITVNSGHSLIENNVIRNTGFQGIDFNGSDVIVKNNLIDSFCIVKDDGGGIYSAKGPFIFKKRQVTGNIIINGIGEGKGINDSNKVSAHGVYMDNNASKADIRDNTIANCNGNGINIHDSFGMTMENNTMFNNTIQLNMVQDSENVPIRHCVVLRNILFSKFLDQWVLSLRSNDDSIKSFGRFDSNYYARPLDDGIIVYNNYVGAKGGTVIQNFDLEGWKQTSGQDKYSKKTSKQIIPFKIISLVDSNKFVYGGDFTKDIKGVSVNSGSCKVSQSTSGLLDGGYLQVTPSSRGSSIFMSVGSVTAGKNYVLSYSVRGSVDSNMTIGVWLKQSGSPYADLTPLQTRKIHTSRVENQMIFSPSKTQSLTNVIFRVDNQNKYYLDNIRFCEANAQITNPDDSISFEYNATRAIKTIALNGTYIDVSGKKYSNSISLQPYTSAVLIKESPIDKNIPPTISITTPVNNTVFNPFSTVSINAVAADADGAITKVEFYKSDSVLLKTEYIPPFECTLDSLAPGNYIITARATDNKGVATTSSPVAFSVAFANLAPIVNVTIPAITSGFKAPATIDLIAAATDSDGSIARVEFFNGSTLLITEHKFPYTYSWQNVAEGSYLITARATDNKGVTTTSDAVAVSVNAKDTSVHLSSRPARGVSKASPVMFNTLESMPGNARGLYTDSDKPGRQTDLSALPDFRVTPDPAIDMIKVHFEGSPRYRKVNLAIQNTSGTIIK